MRPHKAKRTADRLTILQLNDKGGGFKEDLREELNQIFIGWEGVGGSGVYEMGVVVRWHWWWD